MKHSVKLAALVLAMLLVFVLAACGNQPQPDVDDPVVTGSSTPAEVVPGSFSADDLVINIGGKTFKITDSVEDFISALGEGYEYTEAISCAYEGMDKFYIWAMSELATVPPDGKDTVSSFYTSDPEIKTAKSLGAGSSRGEIVAVYGNDYDETSSIITFYAGEKGSIKTPTLFFDMSGDTVQGFGLSAGNSAG